MGQQQLLLLVLGIVIVGLAVVAGIQAFQQNQQQSSIDAMANEALRVATDIQAYRQKPEALGGGQGNWPSNLKEVYPNNEDVEGQIFTTPYGEIEYTGTGGPGALNVDANATADVSPDGTVDIPETGTPSFNATKTGGGDGG